MENNNKTKTSPLAFHFYPLAELPDADDCESLGLKFNVRYRFYEGELSVKARATGEKRPPKKGEWYLSGAVVEAYKAPNNLDTPYYIAELVYTKNIRGTIIERKV